MFLRERQLSSRSRQAVAALSVALLGLAGSSTAVSGRTSPVRQANRMTAGLKRVVLRRFPAGKSAVVDPDGRVLVATNSGVVRLRADASLDRSFGHAGLLSVRVGGRIIAPAVLVVAHRHILVVGIPRNTHRLVAVVRYTLRGRLDRQFGSAGLATVSPPGASGIDPHNPQTDDVGGVATMPDGRIVVAGSVSAESQAVGSQISDFWLARLTRNGTPDVSFGAGGVMRMDVGTRDLDPRLFVQPDGRVVVSGLSASCGPDAGEECGRLGCGPTVACTGVVMRYLSDGSPDSSFGMAGSGVVRFHSDFDSPVLVPERAGQFVVFAGRELTRRGTGAHRPILVRLTQDGRLARAPIVLDRRFDDVHPSSALRQRDGKLILLTFEGTLTRLGRSLRIDDRFGRRGVIRIQTSDSLTTVLSGRNGKLIVIGYDRPNSHLVVLRAEGQ